MSNPVDELAKEVSERKNHQSGGNGLLLRSDIVKLLEMEDVKTPERKQKVYNDFVGKLQFLSEKARKRILSDWKSY